MYYNNNCCGANCQTDDEWSNDDRKALLKEKAAILEAKLATINYMLENLESEEVTSKKK